MHHQHAFSHAIAVLTISTLLSACGDGSSSDPVAINNTASNQTSAQN